MSNRKPKGLRPAGGRLWVAIDGAYDLRADELRILEDACREADLIDAMGTELGSMGLLVEGSQGQQVVNPLVSELRQHRTVLRALMAHLKLPEDGDTERDALERSAKARAAVNVRWARRGA